jgi:hypothetical protein
MSNPQGINQYTMRGNRSASKQLNKAKNRLVKAEASGKTSKVQSARKNVVRAAISYHKKTFHGAPSRWTK